MTMTPQWRAYLDIIFMTPRLYQERLVLILALKLKLNVIRRLECIPQLYYSSSDYVVQRDIIYNNYLYCILRQIYPGPQFIKNINLYFYRPFHFILALTNLDLLTLYYNEPFQ